MQQQLWIVQPSFAKYQLKVSAEKNRSAQSASRGKAKSDVGGNEVSLEAAFGGRTKAANFQHVSSLRYGFQKTLTRLLCEVYIKPLLSLIQQICKGFDHHGKLHCTVHTFSLSSSLS